MDGPRMDRARWSRVQDLFHQAAGLPEDARRRFLESACTDDAAMMQDVLGMLRADASDSSILAHGVGALADRLLEDPPRLPATAFGPYRVTRLLGQGGMGVVYLAERGDLQSVAAIKVLRDAWLSPLRHERFALEQRTLAQLNHPSIARLYDAGTLEDGTPWFAMEYVEGESLTGYCAHHALTPHARLSLFRDVCEAVQHAHSRLVIHRDLKPSNILVSADGAVKLLDFGIAKRLDGLEDGGADATRTGLRFMTPAYAAPEQFRGAGLGIQTDVYSLGVILYELVAGRPPFDLTAKSSGEIEEIITTRTPAAPSTVAGQRGFSRAEWADVDVMCLKAMHKDAARRYATVNALIRDVERFLEGQAIEARPDTLGYRLGKFMRRRRATVVSATLAVAFLAGVSGFYASSLTTSRNAALVEAARAQRIQRFMLDLFEGDPQAGPADTLRVRTLVDRALLQAGSFAMEPAVQAEVFVTLGGIYQQLGNTARADSLLQLALERRRALLGDDHRDVAEVLVAIGELRIAQAQVDDAERMIREGLEMARRHAPPTSPQVIAALSALGRAFQERSALSDAIAVQQEVVALQRQGGAPEVELAASLSALADAEYYAGHYLIADSLNAETLAIYRRHYGDRHPLVSDILVNLGASQHDRGHYTEAEAHYRAAIDITRRFHGEDSHQLAGNLTMLGRTLLYAGRVAEADSLLRRAAVIRERVYGPVHPAVASTVNELAGIALREGRLNEAERLYDRMRSIYERLYEGDHYLTGIAISNLGGVASRRGDLPRAERLMREAVRQFAATQGADHLNTAIARVKLGRVLTRQGRFRAAEAELLAGYERLSAQANPSLLFLQIAREDLAVVYGALSQPELGTRFRTEFVAESTKAAVASRQ